MTNMDAALDLAQKIATAIATKLKIDSTHIIAVRRRGEGPLPWIEIAILKQGKPPETHESSVALPESHFLCDTKEERTTLATYLFKQVALMANKVEPK